MSVNLKLLHTFWRVADLQSFTKAGEELGRTPSAISMQLVELEAQLGTKLLNRTTRKVTVTTEGEILLRRVRGALQDIDEGLEEVRLASEKRQQRVVFGCMPTYAGSRLKGVLQDFQAKRPNIPMSIQELTSRNLLDALRQRNIDFGIGPHAKGTVDLHFERYLREPLYALVPVRFQKKARGPLTLKDFYGLPMLVMQGMPVVVLHNGQETMMELAKVLESSDLPLEIAFRVSQAYTLVELVNSGLGISIVPALSIPSNLPEEIQVARIVEPELVRDVGMYRRKGEPLAMSAQVLAEMIREDLQAFGEYLGRWA